jgi:hypothetical protein
LVLLLLLVVLAVAVAWSLRVASLLPVAPPLPPPAMMTTTTTMMMMMMVMTMLLQAATLRLPSPRLLPRRLLLLLAWQPCLTSATLLFALAKAPSP